MRAMERAGSVSQGQQSENVRILQELQQAQQELEKTKVQLSSAMRERDHLRIEERPLSASVRSSFREVSHRASPVHEIAVPAVQVVIDESRLREEQERSRAFELEVRRLHDKLDEEKLANEQLQREIRVQGRGGEAAEDDGAVGSLADELGGAFAPPPAAVNEGVVLELQQRIAAIHAEKENILKELQRKEFESVQQGEQAALLQKEMERLVQQSQESLELERRRREAAEAAAREAWDRAQGLLREASAAEDLKQRLLGLEESQQRQTATIAQLEVRRHARGVCVCVYLFML
jgi:hypothetical protein